MLIAAAAPPVVPPPAALPPDVVMAHWAGPVGLMETIRTILDAAEEMVGNRVWKRLQRIVGGRQS